MLFYWNNWNSSWLNFHITTRVLPARDWTKNKLKKVINLALPNDGQGCVFYNVFFSVLFIQNQIREHLSRNDTHQTTTTTIHHKSAKSLTLTPAVCLTSCLRHVSHQLKRGLAVEQQLNKVVGIFGWSCLLHHCLVWNRWSARGAVINRVLAAVENKNKVAMVEIK